MLASNETQIGERAEKRKEISMFGVFLAIRNSLPQITGLFEKIIQTRNQKPFLNKPTDRHGA